METAATKSLLRKATTFLLSSLSFFLFFSPQEVWPEDTLLHEGIRLYKQENYGEAAKVLEKARRQDPSSSTAAFFLGLAYKQLMDYQKALPNLRDAVTLEPKIKEALVELIEVLYQLYEEGKVEEAKKWIEVAEKEDIYPAKVAFLKGLILAKEGNHSAAREAFEKAKSLDNTLAQSAEVQIALSLLNEKEFKKARERLKAAIQQDPTTDLAGFARQYQDVIEKRLEMEKPIRVLVSTFGQYDTNVVLKPVEGSLAPDITNKDSFGLASSLRFDYLPIFEGPWLFNAQYAILGNWYQRYSTSHDWINNSLYMAPGYNFGTSALNLALRYNKALVKSPSYKSYLDVVSAGPLYRVLAGESKILEFFGGYSRNDFTQPSLTPEENRDSNRFNAYGSWIWLFKKNAFFNFKYEYSHEDTRGANWDNSAHSFASALTLPLVQKLSLQLSGEVVLQNYQNVHTVFHVKRRDNFYTGTAGLAYELIRNLNLIFQYTRTRADSNIGIYDYERSIYSAGFEYRF